MNGKVGEEIFLICPVRKITKAEKKAIARYIAALKKAGHGVYWPLTDTKQDDPVGLRICQDNCAAIKKRTVHVWWNGTSKGSFFDLGMAFALRRPMILANGNQINMNLNDILQAVGGTEEKLVLLEKEKEVHICWNGVSPEACFYFGMVFALGKKIILDNYDQVLPTPYKSFDNVLREIGKRL